MDFVSVIDAQFKKALGEGAFDNLPQEGAPLDGLERNTVDVWLEGKLSEEGWSLPLPDGLALRKDVKTTLKRLRTVRDEREVRAALTEINARIVHANARHILGLSAGLCAIPIERWLREWRGAEDG